MDRNPGVLIIIASVIGGLIQKASLSCLLNVFVSTVKQLKNSIIAISAIVAMATVMDVCGLIGTLAQSLVDLTGGAYLFIAPVIGALGTLLLVVTQTPTFCLVNCRPLRLKNCMWTRSGWLPQIHLAQQAAK